MTCLLLLVVGRLSDDRMARLYVSYVRLSRTTCHHRALRVHLGRLRVSRGWRPRRVGPSASRGGTANTAPGRRRAACAAGTVAPRRAGVQRPSVWLTVRPCRIFDHRTPERITPRSTHRTPVGI